MSRFKRVLSYVLVICMLFSFTSGYAAAAAKNWTETKTEDGFMLVTNKGGATLGYSPKSGVKLLTIDGFAFKDLNKNNKLDPYEDWRLDAKTRAKDLASKLTLEEIAGLMLYSSHQSIDPSQNAGFGGGTYGGKAFDPKQNKPSDLTDQQKTFLKEDNLRAVLITSVKDTKTAAEWNNNAQSFVEGFGSGVPINTSSDPRHSTSRAEAYKLGGEGSISMWPSHMGLAAAFDPAVVEEFGRIASAEYRALGITTALSPQIDIASDPRWARNSGTFGEDPALSRDLARAYTDGFQSTYTATNGKTVAGGWGMGSVNAMIKHFPGDGAGEVGRESHIDSGKYTVYPTSSFATHLIPFVDGGFKLNGPTKSASAVMSSYSIAYDIDKRYGELVGTAYSEYKIKDLLRGQIGYDGVVCTDWMITSAMPWGVEDSDQYSTAMRHYLVLMAGVDQFGGNNDKKPVLEAYDIGVERIGEKAIRARFEQSAVRLLLNIFNPGVFENPYLVTADSVKEVGNSKYMQAGYNAQLKSIVMLKNDGKIIKKATSKKPTVYIPMMFTPKIEQLVHPGFGMVLVSGSEANWAPAVDLAQAGQYYNIVTDTLNKGADPKNAKPSDYTRRTDFKGVDYALAFINAPQSPGTMFYRFGFDERNVDAKKNISGYFPVTLQYGKYTATTAREKSIATDPKQEAEWIKSGGKAGYSRSYKGISVISTNSYYLDLVNDVSANLGKVPLVLGVRASGAMVFGEIEKKAAAIVMGFGSSDQAMLDIVAGKTQSSGLLPMQMPRDMAAVEAQAEDKPRDTACYKDASGNTYDFAFGMNWAGVINDSRTAKYKKPALRLPTKAYKDANGVTFK